MVTDLIRFLNIMRGREVGKVEVRALSVLGFLGKLEVPAHFSFLFLSELHKVLIILSRRKI